MRTILTIRQQDFDPSSPVIPSDDFYKRRAARAIVYDQEGKVGLLYVSHENYYKLPGGGIDEGEDISAALHREAMEELGCTINVLGEVGEIVEYRDYWRMVQTSYCFLAKVTGKKGTPSFTDLEKSGGFKMVWADNLEAALKLVESTTPKDFGEKFMQKRDATLLKAAGALAAKINE